MIPNKIINIILLTLLTTFFTACVPKDVEVYQQGDQLLSCNQITTKIADLIDINYEVNENTGLEIKSIAAWYIFTPLGAYNQFSAFDARNNIDKRFNYLINLKQQYGCELTHREIAFKKYKGRVSEDIKKMKQQYDDANKKGL